MIQEKTYNGERGLEAMIIPILALIGLVLSAYTVKVKYSLNTPGYKPYCDLSKNVSCSKAFSSKYGTVLRLHNGFAGIAFYLLVLVAWYFDQHTAVLTLAVLGVLASLVLAYLSYVKMKNFCVVCTAVYVVNMLLLLVL